LNVLENSVFCVKFQMSAQKFKMCDCWSKFFGNQ
jgi:hypothetical protein